MKTKTYVLNKVKKLSSDDWPEWFKKRKRRNPFFGNWFFPNGIKLDFIHVVM